MGPIAGWRIVQRRGHRALDVDHVLMAEPVEFAGRDACLDVRGDEIQNFGGEPPGNAHAGDIGSGFQNGGHARNSGSA